MRGGGDEGRGVGLEGRGVGVAVGVDGDREGGWEVTVGVGWGRGLRGRDGVEEGRVDERCWVGSGL